MNYVTLNNGVNMPLLGLGVFQIPDPARAVSEVAVQGDRYPAHLQSRVGR